MTRRGVQLTVGQRAVERDWRSTDGTSGAAFQRTGTTSTSLQRGLTKHVSDEQIVTG